MRIIYFFLLALLISKCSSANTIFETSEYELNFSSNNINLVKVQTLPPDANADTRILRCASLNILTAGLRIGCGLVVDFKFLTRSSLQF